MSWLSFRRRASAFFGTNRTDIFKSIKQLQLEGSVSVVEEAETGRRKIVYGITEQGCDQLDSWLALPPEEPVMRNELLMKLFVSDERHIPQLITFLEEELIANEQLITMLAGIKASVPTGESKQAQLWLLTLDYGERYLRMTLEWCKHALETLNHPNTGD